MSIFHQVEYFTWSKVQEISSKLAQDAEQFDDLFPIVKYIYKQHNKGIASYNPSFREEVATYAAQVLKLTHYRVCLQFFIGGSIGNIGLVKDLDTGIYYYVADSLYVQNESKLFHFTSEELKSEKWRVKSEKYLSLVISH